MWKNGEWGTQSLQAMRHPHPQEVAFLNALDPMYVTPAAEVPLRLDLAGVEQLASPIQGAWALANMILQSSQHSVHDVGISPDMFLPKCAATCLAFMMNCGKFKGIPNP